MLHECGQVPNIENCPDGLHPIGSTKGCIEKIDGMWMAHNYEYYVPVNYCPFCGIELATLEDKPRTLFKYVTETQR